MKIYAIGNFVEDRERVRKIAHVLEDFGHTITMPWYDTEPSDFGSHNAILDVAGVRDADVLVALMDQPRTWQGTWSEIGMAIITGKPVYIMGPKIYWMKNIFTSHPLVMPFDAYWPMDGEILDVKAAAYGS